MRARRPTSPWFLAGLVAFAATWGGAAHADAPLVCHDGGVEMIIGGAAEQGRCAGKPQQRGASASSVPPAHDAMRVSGRDQQRREMERRAILQQELQQEQLALAAQLGGGTAARDPAALVRTRGNVEALKRELARLPD